MSHKTKHHKSHKKEKALKVDKLVKLEILPKDEKVESQFSCVNHETLCTTFKPATLTTKTTIKQEIDKNIIFGVGMSNDNANIIIKPNNIGTTFTFSETGMYKAEFEGNVECSDDIILSFDIEDIKPEVVPLLTKKMSSGTITVNTILPMTQGKKLTVQLRSNSKIILNKGAQLLLYRVA